MVRVGQSMWDDIKIVGPQWTLDINILNQMGRCLVLSQMGHC